MVEIEGFDNEIDSDLDDDDSSNYSPKSEFKKALLAMESVRKCVEALSKEMKPGFWNNKIDKNGNAVKIWIEDQRKVFINSVIALEGLLSAECLDDEKFQAFKKEMDKKTDDIFNKYAYAMYEFDPRTSGWKKTQTKIMPQVEEELLVPSPTDPMVLMNIRGGWDHKVNAYFDELVPLYIQIFKELNKVIYRLNDFGEKFSDY